MSLVGKIAKENAERRVSRQFGERADRQNGRQLKRGRGQAQQEKANFVEEFKRFSLDEKFLNKQGFYTPEHKPQKLSQEMRNIKHKLLRRLEFYKLEDEGGSSRRSRRQKRQRNIVMTTSSRPAEGKTFTAINLALSLAIEDGINVILIDADIPRPKIFSHFGLSGNLGLTDCVHKPMDDLSDYMIEMEEAPLKLMSEGQAARTSPEVFNKAEIENFISSISRKYPDHMIIVDTPPVLATPQAALLASYIDEVIFVIEANVTPSSAAANAIEELIDSNINISIVLNKCLVSSTSKEYGSYEEYYYRSSSKSP